MKNLKSKSVFVAVVLVSFLAAFNHASLAQSDAAPVDLVKKIMDSTAKDQLYPVMEETANLYFKQNKFKEFAELLESLRTKRPNMNAVIDYYVALCRYTHLKYLEQSQNWEEYFANGNSYRQQTVSLATSPTTPVRT